MATYTLNNQPLNYGPFRSSDGRSHSSNVLDLWTDEQLAEIGVVRIPQVSPTPLTLYQLKDSMTEMVRNLRYIHETAGIDFFGTTIRTDERSQNKLSGAISYFSVDPSVVTVDWESTPGVFATLPKTTVQAIAVAVGEHVQLCFTRSKELCEAITNASTIELLQAININSGWP
jgi:hypothetical protein